VWKNSRKRKLLNRSAGVVHAPAARSAYPATGSGVTWAVLDTGVYAAHPHFKRYRNIEDVWDCTRTGRPSRIARAKDADGHGTHVCGIIAGSQDAPPSGDGGPYLGLAPEASLRVYRVLDDDGDGEDAWIIKALDHIAETNDRASSLVVHGVNLSLGGAFDPEVYGCGFSPICQELRRLWRQGVVVCVACGNEGQVRVETSDGEVDLNMALSVGDPANLEECIAVGSVNADRPHLYGISYFSSRGPTADGRAKPDVVAPGEWITSCSPDGRYVTMSGTSMACPHVSGLIAGFLSARREFIGRPDDVKRILLENCTDLRRDRYHQGAGIPNLMRMLEST
jgi:subtilisin family serine protease